MGSFGERGNSVLPDLPERGAGLPDRVCVLVATSEATGVPVPAVLFGSDGLPLGTVDAGRPRIQTPFEGFVGARGHETLELKVRSGERSRVVSLHPSAMATGSLGGTWQLGDHLIAGVAGEKRVVQPTGDGRFSFGPVAAGHVSLDYSGDGFLASKFRSVFLGPGNNELGTIHVHRFAVLVIRALGGWGATGRVHLTRHFPGRGMDVATRSLGWYVYEQEVIDDLCTCRRVYPGPARLTLWTADGWYGETDELEVGEQGETNVAVPMRGPGSLVVQVEGARGAVGVMLADAAYEMPADHAARQARLHPTARLRQVNTDAAGLAAIEGLWSCAYDLAVVDVTGAVLARDRVTVESGRRLVHRLVMGADRATLMVKATGSAVHYALVGRDDAVIARAELAAGAERRHEGLLPGRYEVIQISPVAGGNQRLVRRSLELQRGGRAGLELPLK